MAYCAICGRTHDADLPCFDSSSQAMRCLGSDDRRHLSDQDFRKIAKLADKWMMKLLLVSLALIAALMILSTVLVKKVF